MGEHQYNHPIFVFVLHTECSREGGKSYGPKAGTTLVDKEIRPCFCTSTLVLYDCNGRRMQLDIYRWSVGKPVDECVCLRWDEFPVNLGAFPIPFTQPKEQKKKYRVQKRWLKTNKKESREKPKVASVHTTSYKRVTWHLLHILHS